MAREELFEATARKIVAEAEFEGPLERLLEEATFRHEVCLEKPRTALKVMVKELRDMIKSGMDSRDPKVKKCMGASARITQDPTARRTLRRQCRR
ncbi:MAG: hypothetical protein QXZ11_07105 [Thermoproteota archaeon]